MYNKIIHFIPALLIFCFVTNAIAEDKNSSLWKEASAQFEIIQEDIENLKLENTVLGMLIKQSGKNINELLENDKKTLLSFSIKYKAPVKLKNEQQAKERVITQYGLYRTLDPAIQSHVTTKSKDHKIKIRFVQNDPILIEFIINGTTISAPVLLTDTIDAGWQKAP